MAAPKRATHEVLHPQLHMGKDKHGKLNHMKKGTLLTLTNEQAEKLGKRVKAIGGETTDLTNADPAKVK